VSLLTTLATA